MGSRSVERRSGFLNSYSSGYVRFSGEATHKIQYGETAYVDFLTGDSTRNIYQVSHQITMDKAHQGDVLHKNRYDVTIFINGLPLVQIELKRSGVEINEAINQINRYRNDSPYKN